MSDLLETIDAIFPSVLSGHLAARLGASQNSMKRVTQGAVPIMLSGITIAATKNAAATYALCQRVQPAQNGVTGILVMLGGKDAADSSLTHGTRLLQAAFGSAEQTIINELGQYARLQPAQVRLLLELVGAALLGAVGKYATQHALTAEGVAAALVSLKGRVKAMLPRELEGLVAVLELRVVSRWKFNQPTAYAMIRQAAFRQGRAQWYLVAMALLMTGIGAAAFGALRWGGTAQQSGTAATPQAVQVIEVSNPPSQTDF